MWALEFSPKEISDIVHNREAANEVLRWVEGWGKSRQGGGQIGHKALMLVGPTGCGKTGLIRIVAKKTRRNVVETDASDVRSAKALRETFGMSLSQQSLFYTGKIVVFDELEGISGNEDRGAAKEIMSIIETTKHPVILITSDLENNAAKALKKSVKIVKMTVPSNKEVVEVLSRVCKEKKVNADDKALSTIARLSGGDVRAAINDLESIATGFSLDPQECSGLGYRDSERSVKKALLVILKTLDAGTADRVMQDLEAPPEDMIQWVRENVPHEYSDSEDLARAFEKLSRADIFIGRVSKMQYYRYLVYASSLMSCGVACAKKQKYSKPVPEEFRFPSRIRWFAQTRFKRAKEDAIAKAIGPLVHCSRHEARQYFPLLRLIAENDPRKWAELSAEAGIEEAP